MARIEIFTLVLDGMPWITHHLPVFNRLNLDWRWTIAHGVSANVRDTAWMKSQQPRLSRDGTTEYLTSIKSHPRVRILEAPIWDGKTAMCNACLSHMRPPCVVLQVDSDEIWGTPEIEAIVGLFAANPNLDEMQFWCRYFLGPNIVIGPRDGRHYGCRQTEWRRAWFMRTAAQRFITHEPPVFAGVKESMSRDATHAFGISFDHYAYATRPQVEYKESVYGYPNASANWDRLQRNTVWPVRLRDYFHWVDPDSTADLLIK